MGNEKKFCQNCGAKIDAKASVCIKCGVKCKGNSIETTSEFSIGVFIFWIVVCWPVAIWYYLKHKE